MLDMVFQKARCVCSINVTSDIRPFQLTSALETKRNLRCRIQGHLSFQSQRIPVSNIEIPNLLSIRSIAGFRFGKSPTQHDSLGVAEDGRNLQTAWAPGHTMAHPNPAECDQRNPAWGPGVDVTFELPNLQGKFLDLKHLAKMYASGNITIGTTCHIPNLSGEYLPMSSKLLHVHEEASAMSDELIGIRMAESTHNFI